MKYVDEYREGDAARRIAAEIRHEADPKRIYRFMEFCGGHTHVLARWGLTDILPPNVRMIHGPGCPVCVLPVARIDMAMQLALERNVILCTYADTMRVPAGKGMSLFKAKAQGADIRMIYSPMDALELAKANPEREVVFFAIGFETTTPPTAVVLKAAKAAGVKNFSVFCNHVLTPAAMTHILKMSEERPEVPVLDGLVGPAHVSTIIGSGPYEVFARENRLPVVVTGFEPLDMLYAILMMVRQVNDGRHEVENEFTRAVTRDGNVAAIRLMDEVFELRDSFEWRGLGRLPKVRPEASPRMGGLRRGKALCHDRARRHGQQGLRLRRDPERRKDARTMPALWPRLQSRQPDRCLHGLLGRRLCGRLELRPTPRRRA